MKKDGTLAIWDPMGLLKKGKCPFCETQDSKKVACRRDGLPLLECEQCGLAYVDPRPNSQQLDDYYSSSYFLGRRDFFAHRDYCQVRDQAIVNKSITGYSEIISSLDLRDKSILEIGCGSGALLQLLKGHGPSQLIGIDRAEYPIAYGRSRYGLDLRSSILEKSRFTQDSFDLIIMIDLIEHIEDLPEFLREIDRVLRPDGFLFILTPNHQAFRRTNAHWIGLCKDFEHLQYFSCRSLEAMAGKFQWTLTHWWTRGLPVSLSQYPKFLSRGLHRLRYPHVSITNGIRKLRYTPWSFLGKGFGHELLAIIRKR